MIFFKTILSFLKDEEYRQLLYTTLAILGLGTLVYRYLEGWSWIDSLYFSVITLTTVGYGDVYPVTGIGKFLSSIIAIIGIGFVALPTGILSSAFMERIKRKESRNCQHCGKPTNM